MRDIYRVIEKILAIPGLPDATKEGLLSLIVSCEYFAPEETSRWDWQQGGCILNTTLKGEPDEVRRAAYEIWTGRDVADV